MKNIEVMFIYNINEAMIINFNALVENKEYFIEKWKAEDGDELRRYRAKEFFEIIEDGADFTEWENTQTVHKDKIWEIQFNSIMDEKTITEENIYIENNNKEKQDITLSIGENNDSIVIYPPENGYDNEYSYTLYITKDVKNINSGNLKSGITMRFYIEREESYEVKLSEDAIVIESSEIKAITADKIVLESSREVAENEIIIIEPSDEYPTGLARKVIGTMVENGETVLITEEPIIEEFIEEMDINTIVELNFSNFGSQEGLTEGVKASEYIGYNEEGKYEKGILYNINKTETIRDPIDPEISTTITIIGEVKLVEPKIEIETGAAFEKGKDKTVKLVFKSKVRLGLEIEGEFKGEVKREEVTLAKYNIIIPGTLGLSIEPELKAIAEAEASGKFKFGVSTTQYYEIGAILENGELKKINKFEEKEKLTPEVAGEAKIEGKAGNCRKERLERYLDSKNILPILAEEKHKLEKEIIIRLKNEKLIERHNKMYSLIPIVNWLKDKI